MSDLQKLHISIKTLFKIFTLEILAICILALNLIHILNICSTIIKLSSLTLIWNWKFCLVWSWNIAQHKIWATKNYLVLRKSNFNTKKGKMAYCHLFLFLLVFFARNNNLMLINTFCFKIQGVRKVFLSTITKFINIRYIK